MVAFRGLQIDAMEPCQVIALALRDGHPQLVCLLDVASPQLVHALQELLICQGSPVGVAQAQLIVELRLPRSETGTGALLLPAEMLQAAQHPGPGVCRLVGGDL